MTPPDIERAAELLHAARRDAQLTQGIVGPLQPDSIADAYAIQAGLTRRFGRVVGWKIAGIVPEQRDDLKVAHPIAAPIFTGFVHESPANVARRAFVYPQLEGELAFLLARDLPPRPLPYRRDEVEAAIGAVVLGLEITDQRVPQGVPTPVRLADCFGSGAYVRGAVHADWRAIDLLAQPVVVRVDGKEITRGTGASIPGGGPLHAMMMIANHQPVYSAGLKAGQFVTTGSCTRQLPLGDGRAVTVDFGGLGMVRANFT